MIVVSSKLRGAMTDVPASSKHSGGGPASPPEPAAGTTAMLERLRRAGSASWALVGLAAVVALVGFVAYVVRVIWPPLILAGAIVFLLNPVVTALQQRHVPRVLATAFSYLAVVGVLVLVGLLVAPLATRQYDDLAERWPELRADLESQVDDLAVRSEEGGWPIRIPNARELEDQFFTQNSADTDGDGVISEEERQDRFAAQIDTARELALSVFHVGIVLVLAPIIAFYLLVDLPHLRNVFRSLVPPRARGDAMVVTRRLSTALGGYFRGQLAVAFVVGVMSSIAMLIIDLPFWLIVGMIAGVFNMIPLIGPYIGAVPGIVIALTTGGGFGKAIAVAVAMTIVQQIDNHFISPIVMQRAVKLHPAAVMLALVAGGTLMGFLGLLLAVPTVAALKIIVGHAWRHYVLGEPLDKIEADWELAYGAKVPGGVADRVGDDPAEPAPEVAAEPAGAPEPKGGT